VDTVASVAGSGKPTVLFAWACLSQFSQNFWGPSINEALLLLPNGGTLASFGPAGISSPGSQLPLVEGVYRNLRPGVRLGDLVRQAKAEAMRSNPESSAKAVEGFNLIGDPALRLPWSTSRSWDAAVRPRTAAYPPPTRPATSKSRCCSVLRATVALARPSL
jgi:hypothetical protein